MTDRNFTRPVYGGEGKRQIRSFVRRQGRMSNNRWNRYQDLRDRFCIPFQPERVDLCSLYPKPENPLILEIGFGMGRATIELASSNPRINYLGIEVHTPGVASVLEKIDELQLDNLRIIEHDAVEVLQYMCPDGIFHGVHIFFPDPWPKKRHFKRRLVQKAFLDLLAPRIRSGGYLYAVTDWEDYAAWMLDELALCPSFRNSCEGYSPALPWRPKTAFEQKGLDKNHSIRELYFIKNPAL